MEIKQIKITDLKEYANNPRINDGVVDKDYVIVCGHTRLKAAKKLGLTEVPVIMADELTPEQINAFRLVDNRTNEVAL